MKRIFWAGVLVPVLGLAGLLAGCGGGEGDSGSGEGATSALDDDGLSPDTDGGVKKLTWLHIYDEAFAPGTPGHCGNSGCHEKKLSGFECGTTAKSCLDGMIAKGLINTKSPKTSLIGSTKGPLRWFGGIMPKDNTTPEPKLAADITKWLAEGAVGD